MISSDKSQRMTHAIVDYNDFCAVNRKHLSFRYNMFIHICLYILLVMNMCCIMILMIHHMCLFDILSGRLSLFGPSVPLELSIALIAIIPVVILSLVLLYKKSNIQSVKSALVDKSVNFVKHFGDCVKEVETHANKLQLTICSLQAEYEQLAVKQAELAEACKLRSNTLDLKLSALSNTVENMTGQLRAHFVGSDSKVKELSERLSKLCSDSQSAQYRIDLYIASVGEAVRQEIYDISEKTQFLQQLYIHLTESSVSFDSIKFMIKKYVEYVENRPHLKKCAGITLRHTKVWVLYNSLKETLSSADHINSSDDCEVIEWGQNLIKILERQKFGELNVEEVSCSEDEKTYIQDMFIVNFPLLHINCLRLVADRHSCVLQRSCAALQGFSAELIAGNINFKSSGDDGLQDQGTFDDSNNTIVSQPLQMEGLDNVNVVVHESVVPRSRSSSLS
ncbi:hypothetical protein EDL79_00575 [Ehrlichia ruminantium]|uniref:Uncharacterized protein n=2 Tax=Ehrlichia ruminantium TaxID=779 RepID=A0AAE6QA91_EHRRU|nr:hypothetical protein [Ehrlichia ruminantium]QGR03113.1 hypothetical protein EDL80_00575 [Ehrlichia ruminantium]QGR04038.1 hypothetical protein EDL79_00575 [Ehrlichia ruminantium]